MEEGTIRQSIDALIPLVTQYGLQILGALAILILGKIASGFAARLVRKADRPVVILGRGDLDKMLTVSAHRFSGSARQKIEAAGGQAIDLELPVTGARATVRKLRKADLARAAQADTEA